jgi:hypothetical protein
MGRGSKRQRAAPAATNAESGELAAELPPKPKRTYDKPCSFLATWLWKRESKCVPLAGFGVPR